MPETSKIAASYKPSSLDSDGFIHCSTINQTVDTANLFFRNEKDLVILCIDEKKIKARKRHYSLLIKTALTQFLPDSSRTQNIPGGTGEPCISIIPFQKKELPIPVFDSNVRPRMSKIVILYEDCSGHCQTYL